MALVLKDRVKETTTTTGTGSYALGNSVAGFQDFSVIGNNNTTFYCCTDRTDFEVGLGTYSSSGNTLARTTILSSSNGGDAINWSAGDKDIFVTQPSDKAVYLDGSNHLTVANNLTVNGNLDFNGASNTQGVATFQNYLNRTTTDGNSAWLQQDGTGRVHWYWNTTGGTSPTLTNGNGEDAASISLTTGGTSGAPIFFRHYNAPANSSAGDAITWTESANFQQDRIYLKRATEFSGVIKLPNLEKSNLTVDGDFGFDSSQGLLVYRTQQGTTGTVSVLDGANVDAGALIDITNLGTGGTATEAFTFSVDLSELTDMTQTLVSSDEFVVLDSGAQRRKAASEIGLSVFNNDSGYITSVPAQTFASLTGKPTTLSGYGITDAFDGAYSSLTGTPTIPGNTSDLTNDSGFITSADGGNAQTLDGLYSTQFLRSDAADTKTSGNLTFSDNVKAVFGEELEIYSDASGSIIDGKSGDLIIKDSGSGLLKLRGAYVINIENADGSKNVAEFQANGGVTLRHNDSIRFQTIDAGVNVIGDVRITGNKNLTFLNVGSGNHDFIIQPPSSPTGARTLTLPDLTGTLAITSQIPSNVSDFTNDSGYITSVPAQSFASLTGKPTTIAGYGITDAFDGAYSSLSGRPTLASSATTDTTDASNISSGILNANRLPDLTVSELAANSLTTSSESFADNDTTLMTSAAINDRIESFGYSTTTGTVTSVGTTGTVNGITLTGTVTGSGDLTLGGTLANITVSQLAGSALTTSSESFADNDTTLMTSAAINDRITSFGYITSVPAQSFSSLTGKPTTISGYGITDAFDGAYSSLTGTPTIPSNTNQLTNGAGFITSTVTGTLTTDAIRFGDSHVKRISVDYRGSDYLVDNEYQKILTITPTNSSRNYSIIGRIMATSGSYVHTLDINVALRTNTLPDLSYSGTYTSTITGTTEYLTPRMWVKETTTAGFELVIEVNAQIYGRLNADLEIITREEADLATVVVNTIEDSEVTSVTTGFTQYNLTKVFETDDGVFALTNGVLDLKNTGSQSEVRLYCESSNAYYASLKAPAHVDISSNVTLTLPATTSTLLSTASNLSDLANVATTSPSSGEVLKWNGSAWSPAADAGGSSGLSNVVEDTTPQLGGTLDTANQLIQFGDSSGATVNRLQIGTGQDLSLYHDGTNSYITHNNVVTSSLILQNINTDSNSTDGIRIETIDNTASGLDNYVHLPNNAGVRLGVSGIDRVSVLTSGSFFNHDIVLNGSSHELKFRGSSYYTILDAVVSDSQDHTVTLPASTGTVPVFTTAPTGAIADGTNGQVLSTDGAGTLSFTTVSGGSSGLSNLVEDTSPQLGGDLDTNGFQINMDDQKSIQFSSGSYYGFINYNSTFNPYGNSNGTMTVTAFGAPLRLTSSFENTYLGSQFSAVNIIETNNLATNTPLIVRTNTGSATDNLFKIDYQGTATFEKGVVDIKNSGSQSEVRLYCESANQHYAALKAPAHVDISSNVTLTLPATTSTLLSTASNLNDLANVSVGSPDNGYVLKYNSSESRWEAAPDATGSGGGGSATNADTVDNLHLSVVTSMPASPNSSTIYFVTG